MKRIIGWVFAVVLVVALSSFSAFSDDTELFTTRANPDVLLVVDASPSMNTVDALASPAVPNLNGRTLERRTSASTSSGRCSTRC